MVIESEYFNGNKISEFGLQHKRLDFGTMCKGFNMILCNEVVKLLDLELVSGTLEDDEEIFQYYIIDRNFREFLERETNEIVFYNFKMDIFVLGVTHWGTSWDYILTDIPIK